MNDHASLTTIDPDPDWMKTDCVCTSVRRVSRSLTRIYDDAMRPSGLTTVQYSMLSALNRAPERVTMTQLAEAQVMDRTTLTRNLHPLEREGLVRIEAGEDKRTRYVHLTETGRDRIAVARPLWQAIDREVSEEAGPGRIEALLQELADLTARIH
ncbi:MAG TPA: MarR family winged helix-turn-helix transcriptional regulator [Thermomicrobiales bacterium]|nr:MarR family winged helix-turn-helix transcriptional regulator [Thermomicrobiales bacterium]